MVDRKSTPTLGYTHVRKVNFNLSYVGLGLVVVGSTMGPQPSLQKSSQWLLDFFRKRT